MTPPEHRADGEQENDQKRKVDEEERVYREDIVQEAEGPNDREAHSDPPRKTGEYRYRANDQKREATNERSRIEARENDLLEIEVCEQDVLTGITTHLFVPLGEIERPAEPEVSRSQSHAGSCTSYSDKHPADRSAAKQDGTERDQKDSEPDPDQNVERDRQREHVWMLECHLELGVVLRKISRRRKEAPESHIERCGREPGPKRPERYEPPPRRRHESTRGGALLGHILG